MNVAVLVFPGSNCDRDVYSILNRISPKSAEYVWYTHEDLRKYDAVVVPGGFSFGDRLRAGAIAARAPVMNEVRKRAAQGTPVLGICNGFQILVEAGLLPGALVMNQSSRFVCRWTRVKVENTSTPFTSEFKEGEEFDIPVAHGEGRFIAERSTLDSLKRDNRIVLTYANDDPNGSFELVAAVCNKEGNVMGMMPHPERASDEQLTKDKSIRASMIFRSLARFLAGGKA